MTWTPERKLEAAVQAPLARAYVREDTRIIERPGWYQVVTPSASTYLNEVRLSQVEAEDAERVINETIAVYAAHGVRMRWPVGPQTRPADLGERLRRRGFESVHLRAMGIDTAASLGTTEGVTVSEIEATTLDGFVSTVLQGWGLPAAEVAHALEETSAPVLERLGFESLFRTTCWSLTPLSCESHDTSSPSGGPLRGRPEL